MQPILSRAALVAASFVIAACGKSAGNAADTASPSDVAAQARDQAAAVAQQAGVPSAAQVEANKNIRDYDSGGNFEARISGALTADIKAKDASFCNQVMKLGNGSMQVFALSLIGNEYAVAISGTDIPLKVGKAAISDRPDTYGANVIDKRGNQTFYESTGGDVTFTRVDADKVAGTYHVEATRKGGTAKVTADGSFEATKAQGCPN